MTDAVANMQIVTNNPNIAKHGGTALRRGHAVKGDRRSTCWTRAEELLQQGWRAALDAAAAQRSSSCALPTARSLSSARINSTMSLALQAIEKARDRYKIERTPRCSGNA
jgi:hypothetical protein